MPDQPAFYAAAKRFTSATLTAHEWKHNFPGAAYSTRLAAACDMLDAEVAAMRAALKADAEAGERALAKFKTL